ncbi:sugar phosphate isomerase/epimerase family protein [Streptodolium elevatio]|uniref:Sugar phosphate isomerase/epimerase family protein n=1 Tax=Streptodolium elevatio TaxID=3157996 RepID=A0ABV3DS01_9ACTN
MTQPMPWAFSTLGAPGRPVAEHVDRALRHGCTGIELRVHADESVRTDLSARERRDIRDQASGEGLALPCLAGYARICADVPDAAVLTELRALIELAYDLGAPAVRVFPGGTGGGTGGEDHGDADRAERRLSALLPEAAANGVTLLLETHDSHPTGAAVASLLRPFTGERAVAAIWDALHPWRHGEQPDETAQALDGLLGYVQIKDAVSASDTTPVLLGSGAVPLDVIGRALDERAWHGWVSLEWERAWYPHVADLDAVLPGARAWVDQRSRAG